MCWNGALLAVTQYSIVYQKRNFISTRHAMVHPNLRLACLYVFTFDTGNIMTT